MELSIIQIIFMTIVIVFIIGCGIYSARKVHSAEGFSLNGRHTSKCMIAGAIAGSCIGGGATVGTSQMAFTIGLSAWWFTIGIGISFLIIALFFAKPLRNTKLETISQILVLAYKKPIGPVASAISSCGIFFSCVASILPAIHILAKLIDIDILSSSAILFILVTVYIFFGGMKGASVSGIVKTIVLTIMLIIMSYFAITKLCSLPNYHQILENNKWFNLFYQGVPKTLENVVSLVAGVLCAQTYAQIIFSAEDPKTARIGAIWAACVSIPVGLPCVLVAMYMQAQHPDIQPILALPEFIIRYMPETLGGITLGVIIIALISSISGLTLGISTTISRDIFTPLFKIKNSDTIFKANRVCVVITVAAFITFALHNLDSQVLEWNFLSMALRGSLLLPLLIALFKPRLLAPVWAIPTIITGALCAGLSKHIGITLPPFFITLFSGICFIIISFILGHKYNNKIMKLLGIIRYKFHKLRHFFTN
ncbi:MAG: sodium:solute symporter [Succinivibrionaceae bacterium]